MEKVAFYTLGCKVNQYDTQLMAEAFERAGYELVDFGDAADVYIINTCTVTGLSARKSRQAIRKARQLNGSAIIAAVGCYPQTAKKEVEDLPEVDIIAGTSDRARLPELVGKFREGGALDEKGKLSVVADIMKKRPFEDFGIERCIGRTRAFLKVQEGCGQFCSYCIIPYARGPIRSRPPADVAQEVQRLAKKGFREVVLTGIHLASYGKEQGQDRLIDLIRLVDDVDGIDRIRLGSIEPTLLTREFVSAAAGVKKLCPHYHVSLQSGCDETLARMNRRYTTQQYKNAVDLLRELIPDVSVTTDVMVGFPGETDEEFDSTYNFLIGIDFAKMHVFKYSPRKGTPAASYKNQVDGAVKEARSASVIELSDRCALAFHDKFTGREMPVLYEQEVSGKEGVYEGLTPNYIRVLSKANQNPSGNIAATALIKAETDYMEGNVQRF